LLGRYIGLREMKKIPLSAHFIMLAESGRLLYVIDKI